MMKKLILSALITCSLLIQGCASHPLVPSATQGKTFAVYPASIALTVKTQKETIKDLVKTLAIATVTGAATGGYYAEVPPGPGQKVAGGNFGPALTDEFAIRFGREFGMRKVADLKPLGSSKSTGGILTEAEVKSDYQNVADYLVQFDSNPSKLTEESSENYTFRCFVSVNIYDTKTGQRLDWAGCQGVQGAAPLADWYKDDGKMLNAVTQEVASKCADEMIRKLNKN